MRRLLLALLVSVAAIAALPAMASAVEAEDLGTPLAASTFAGAITAGPDGNIWFSGGNYAEGERGARLVGKVTPAGEVAEFEAPPGNKSIVAGADGNLWFAEVEAIGRITPAGELAAYPLPAGTGSPRTLIAGPDGNVWFTVANPAAIGEISPIGAITMFPLIGGKPTAIAAGPAGDLWFTEPEAGKIGRITLAGEVRQFPLPDRSARPNGIALGADGNLWFSDKSEPRVGRITPTGKVTFFAVPTAEDTTAVTAGPGGLIWFTALNEIGTIDTAGKVTWPTCFSGGCQYPPAAMTIGPDGKLWIASGVGHCTGYCGPDGEKSFFSESSSIGSYEMPSVPFGIGPRLAPLRHDRTSVVVACGVAAPCEGTLRLRALVRPPPKFEFTTRLIDRIHYSLAAGEIRKLVLPLPLRRWERLRYGRGFLIVNALEDGHGVAKRGFYFRVKTGGTAK